MAKAAKAHAIFPARRISLGKNLALATGASHNFMPAAGLPQLCQQAARKAALTCRALR